MATYHKQMIQMVVTTLSVFAGFFCLGALVFLHLQYRTRIVALMAAFVGSLLLIDLGFWLGLVLDQGNTTLAAASAGTAAGAAPAAVLNGLRLVLQLAGIALNILVSPRLVAALLSLAWSPPWRVGLAIWSGLPVLAALAYLLAPRLEFLPWLVSGQELLTIAGCLLVLARQLPGLRPEPLRRSLRAFLVTSLVFLVLLLADMLLSQLDLPALAALAVLDNLSLPLYFLALNLLSFGFAGGFLNVPPLVVAGQPSPDCLARYGLTEREAGIITQLLGGRSNQEIADALFISRKTVENHLYNIYQKTEVNSRLQLIQLLQNRQAGS